MSANVTDTINKNLMKGLPECPFYQLYHFVILENKELSEAEIQELLDHTAECEPCRTLHEEVKEALKGQNRSRASRAELLVFLKCLMDPLWGVEHEPHDRFLRKHRLKTKKRIARLERRVQQLEELLKQATSNASLTKEVVSQ